REVRRQAAEEPGRSAPQAPLQGSPVFRLRKRRQGRHQGFRDQVTAPLPPRSREAREGLFVVAEPSRRWLRANPQKLRVLRGFAVEVNLSRVATCGISRERGWRGRSRRACRLRLPEWRREGRRSLRRLADPCR